MEIGVFTFADVRREAGGDPARRLRELVEEIELADEVGLDVFGVGEHHRPEFAVSTPAVVLAAGAARTTRIRLTSAVTVLSSDDPIRVFQEFSTLDLLSGGRAEIMVGRGSFVESFPLFGYDLRDYDALFAEKLELLLHIRETGAHPRGPRGVSRARCSIPCRCGSPSAVRPSPRFAPARSTCRWRSPSSAASPSGSRRSPSCTAAPRAQAGHAEPRLSINSHGYIADSSQRALDESFPYVRRR